jgi:hypothetical protein
MIARCRSSGGFSTWGVNVMMSFPSVIWDADGFDKRPIGAAGALK